MRVPSLLAAATAGWSRGGAAVARGEARRARFGCFRSTSKIVKAVVREMHASTRCRALGGNDEMLKLPAKKVLGRVGSLAPWRGVDWFSCWQSDRSTVAEGPLSAAPAEPLATGDDV
jgi:hypothetical protein